MTENHSRTARAGFPARVIFHLVQFFDSEIQSLRGRLTLEIGFTCEALRQRFHSLLHLQLYCGCNSSACLRQERLAQRRQVIAQRRAWNGVHLLRSAAGSADADGGRLEPPIRKKDAQVMSHRCGRHFQSTRNFTRRGSSVLGQVTQHFMPGGCHIHEVIILTLRFMKKYLYVNLLTINSQVL